jgi:putative DNA primase/helicase
VAAQELANAEDGSKVKKRPVTRNLKADVLEAVKALSIVPFSKSAPCWLDGDEVDVREWIVTQSGMLNVTTREVWPANEEFFAVNALPFAYDENATCPQWLEFLSQLWPDDPQSIDTLQEIIGYLVTTRTEFQKMFMLVGPKRSGKGTIARIIREVCGPANIAGPTLSSLAEPFGLQPLLGKSVAIIGDARLSGRTDSSVITERVLSITGEDLQTVHRKHQTAVTDRLPVRFVLLSNELPKLDDASATLPSRMILLELVNSFYGCEDHTLTTRLMTELPGILNWALDGLRRLLQRKRFVQPEASQELIEELEAIASPITSFIRDCCQVGPSHEVLISDLYARFESWCKEHGRRAETEQIFGRNLRAAVPKIRGGQRRVMGIRPRFYFGIGLQGE